jgi:hypothetical protein
MPPHDALGSFFQPSDQAGNGFVAQKKACGAFVTPANRWVRFFNRPSSPLLGFVAQFQWFGFKQRVSSIGFVFSTL